MLSHYDHLESVPKNWQQWHPSIRKARPLSESLFAAWPDAMLFRDLATLRCDLPLFETINELRWTRPGPAFEVWCDRLQAPDLWERAAKQADGRRPA